MNDTYSAYLQSKAWGAKRKQRMGLSGFACEACGTKSSLQVHHLTYERIFQEDMADLMTLCRIHHEAAEEMVKKGAIRRFGCVAELRNSTLFFVAPKDGKGKKFTKAPKPAKSKPRLRPVITQGRQAPAKKKRPEQLRYELMSDPEFVKALGLRKVEFRKYLQIKFGAPSKIRNRWFSAAHHLFQAHKS